MDSPVQAPAMCRPNSTIEVIALHLQYSGGQKMRCDNLVQLWRCHVSGSHRTHIAQRAQIFVIEIRKPEKNSYVLETVPTETVWCFHCEWFEVLRGIEFGHRYIYDHNGTWLRLLKCQVERHWFRCDICIEITIVAITVSIGTVIHVIRCPVRSMACS